MVNCHITQLPARGAIEVSGGGAQKFLQDIVTNDVTKADHTRAVHAGLLTPQGKILFDFLILDAGDRFLLDCAKDIAAELIKRLTLYKLRAEVDFADLSGRMKVWAAWGGMPRPASGAIVFADPRLDALGWRILAQSAPDTGCETASEGDYHRHRIALGVPEAGMDYPLGNTFPHEADYDQLGGVDFNKGCYVGQEVVSRMEHRGSARKRIVPVRGDAPLTPGAEITAGNARIGALGSVAEESGLAMVRLDRAQKALDEGRALMADGVAITLVQPGWASFSVPTQAGAK